MRGDYPPLDINTVFPGLGGKIIIIIIIITRQKDVGKIDTDVNPFKDHGSTQ